MEYSELSVGMSNFDHIETEMSCAAVESAEVGPGGAAQDGLFVVADGIETSDQRIRLAGADFDEDQNLSVPGDQVDLTPPVPPVSLEDPHSLLAPEETGGSPFSPPADPRTTGGRSGEGPEQSLEEAPSGGIHESVAVLAESRPGRS